jgi:hypothetical protein
MTFPASVTGGGRQTYDVTAALGNVHSLSGWHERDVHRVWSVFDEHIKKGSKGDHATGVVPEPPDALFKPRRVCVDGDLRDRCLRLQVLVFARHHEITRTVRCMEAQETDTTSGGCWPP